MSDFLQILPFLLWLDYTILAVECILLGLGVAEGFNESCVQWANTDHDQVQNLGRTGSVLLLLFRVLPLCLCVEFQALNAPREIVYRISGRYRWCRWCNRSELLDLGVITLSLIKDKVESLSNNM